jgi:surface antigen
VKHRIVFPVVLVGLVASSCTQTAGPRQQGGTVIGAVIGGVVGSQFGSGGGQVAATLIGAALGGLIGNRIGAYLDEEDQRRLAEITQSSLASGSSRSFKNARTGVSGNAKVIETSTNASGQLCRTVQQEVILKDGARLNDTVSACRGAKGWVV